MMPVHHAHVDSLLSSGPETWIRSTRRPGGLALTRSDCVW